MRGGKNFQAAETSGSSFPAAFFFLRAARNRFVSATTGARGPTPFRTTATFAL